MLEMVTFEIRRSRPVEVLEYAGFRIQLARLASAPIENEQVPGHALAEAWTSSVSPAQAWL